MAQLKSISKKLVLIIVTISLLLTFVATPSAEAKLTLGEGEYYYSGTTKGTYKASTNIFSWLLANIGDIADWLLGIMTMGIRMVFVGWTALIEKILTWTLEGTTGVETEDEVSSTDLSSISDSSNNITVQAIVYNQVPAFDVNFFNLEYDKTYSGTGKKLHCDKCDKDVEDCCDPNGTSCTCACKGNCDDCQRYIAALNVTGDPIIVQIKKVVATWYYVMRFLAAAALLIVFIGVGLKMALSTIASEKAVYKRMLVDWVVGAILVFAIHYIMIFVVYMNGALIKVVKESANSINKVSMMQLAEKSDTNIEYTDEELEISIYEAVRTRAYDPKLMNGLTGMLMYMTLVYFAIRYSIVYLKRLLTLIVLTLMAPAVGVSYAIQKVFSGKSQSLTNWATEYTMNVLIQVVHAIIYSVFISTALILSLQSVAGMILALILMNYSLKAEKTFRTIFKMGAGGSLLDHTASAGDAEKLQEGFNTAKGLAMGAKPAAKALMNTPYAKAFKGAAKLGIAGGLYAGSKIKGAFSGGTEEADSQNPTSGGEGSNPPIDRGPTALPQDSGAPSTPVVSTDGTDGGVADVTMPVQKISEENANANLKKLINKGEAGLRKDVIDAMAKGDKEALATAIGNFEKFNNSGANISTSDIIKGHLERMVDVQNNFNIRYDEKGNVKPLSLIPAIFGTKSKDSKTGKWVSNKDGMYTALSSENLLGFTPEDKKIFKEQVLNPIRNGFGGIAAMFVGMGTIVAHPKLGMAMVGGGYAATRKALKKPISAGDYKGTYAFARFSAPTVAQIQKETERRARKEWNEAVVANVKENHPALYKSLVSGSELKKVDAEKFVSDLSSSLSMGMGITAAGVLTGITPIALPIVLTGTAGLAGKKIMGRTAFGSRMDTINAHSAKQLHAQQLKFAEDGYKLQATARTADYRNTFDKIQTRATELAYAEEGLVVDKKGNFTSIEQTTVAAYDQKIQEIYAANGIKYDQAAGTITLPDANGKPQTRTIGVVKEDLSAETADKAAIIQTEIDKVVKQVLIQNPKIDLASKDSKELVTNLLAERLEKAEVVKDDVTIEKVFAKGKDGAVEAIARQLEFSKAKNVAAGTALEGMSDKTRAVVESVVADLSKKSIEQGGVVLADVFRVIEGDGSNAANAKKDGSIRLNSEERARVSEYIKNLETGPIQARTPKGTPIETVKKRKSAEARVQERMKTLTEYVKELATDDQSIENLAQAVQNGQDAHIPKSRQDARKKKLKQLKDLSIDVPTGDTEEDKKAKANGLEALSNAQKDVKALETDVVTREHTGDVLELLLMRREIERVNEVAYAELKLKTGTPNYAQATKDESKAKVDLYKAELEYKQEVFKNEARGDFSHTKQGTDEYLRIEQLNQKMEAARQLLDMAVQEKAGKGPIVSVDAFVDEVARTQSGEMSTMVRNAFNENRARTEQQLAAIEAENNRKKARDAAEQQRKKDRDAAQQKRQNEREQRKEQRQQRKKTNNNE